MTTKEISRLEPVVNISDREAAKSLMRMSIERLNQTTPPTASASENDNLESEQKPMKRKPVPFDSQSSSVKKAKLDPIQSKLSDIVSAIEFFKDGIVGSPNVQLQNLGHDKLSAGNWQCWSHEEEVFLVGAVLERFFSRGSLSSTKKESAGSKNSNCWETIKKTYDASFRKFTDLSGQQCPPERTENALSRHYKVMKERSLGKTQKNRVSFKKLYDEWETKYNKRFNLVAEPDYTLPSMKKKVESLGTKGSAKVNPEVSSTTSRGRWNFTDEVILVGVVLETFFKRGSLSSSHKERKKNENDFWQNLHIIYEKVKMAYSKGQGVSVTASKRTSQALARHFKVMKVKLIQSDGSVNLKTFYREWENNYRSYYLNIETQTKEEEVAKYEENSLKYLQMMTKQAKSGAAQLNGSVTSLPIPSNGAALLANLSSSQGRDSEKQGAAQTKKEAISSTTTARPPFPFQNSASLNSLFSGFNSPMSPAVGVSAVRTFPNGADNVPPDMKTLGRIATPVTGLDLSKVNEMFGSYSNINSGTSQSQTSRSSQSQTPLVTQLVSPSPVVTTNGNATTYWLPLTLYNVNEAEKNVKKEESVENSENCKGVRSQSENSC